MKLFSTFAVLLLTIFFYLYHSNSFTTAEVDANAIFFITSDENAFIAISNDEPGKHFRITNNTGEEVSIAELKIPDSNLVIKPLGNFNGRIPSGGFQLFNITGGGKPGVPNNTIHISVYWNSGSAEIYSIIPETKINEFDSDEEEDLLIDEEGEDTKSETKFEDGDSENNINNGTSETEHNESITEDSQQVENDNEVTDLDEGEYIETETEE